MITIDDINFDIDIEGIYVFESALAHEKKSIGRKALCRRYKSILKPFRKKYPYEWFCFLLAYLEYHDPKFHYDPKERIEGYMLEFDKCYFLQHGCADFVDLQSCWDKAIPCFRDRGFLLSEVSEAVGYAGN